MIRKLTLVLLVACTTALHAQQHIVPDAYPSIQAAIDVATPGDTIMVRAGSYHEFLTLRENVVLKAEGIDDGTWTRALRTIIHSDGLRDGSGNIPPVVNCADGAVLDGFTVTGMDTVNHHLPGHSHAVQNRGTSSTVMNCIVHTNGSTGIGSHDKDGKLANPSIIHNKVYANFGIGIGFNHTSRGIARDNEVFRNREVGIGIQNGAAPEIRDNVVYENGWNGISAREGAWPALIGNTLYNNGTDPTGDGVPVGAGAGIGLDSTGWIARAGDTAERMLVKGNTVSGNPSGGIMSRNSALFQVEENTCCCNGNFQISVTDLSDAIVLKNIVKLTDTTVEAGGIVVARGGTALLRQNDIQNVKTAGLAVTGDATVRSFDDMISGCIGSGVHVDGPASVVELRNTRISNCAGAAIICDEGSVDMRYAILNENVSGALFGADAAVTFVNNTLVSASGAEGRGVAVNGRSGSLCYNNIVVGYSVGFFLEESPTVDYNCTFGNQPYNGPPGTGGPHAMQTDPRFDPQSGADFDLLSSSPCIDAGHTDAQYNDPDGSRADMGARPFLRPNGVKAQPLPGMPRFIAYPSISAGIVTVELHGTQSTATGVPLAVFDLAGRRLMQMRFQETHSALDLSAMPAGMYILRVLTGDGPEFARVLIKH